MRKFHSIKISNIIWKRNFHFKCFSFIANHYHRKFQAIYASTVNSELPLRIYVTNFKTLRCVFAYRLIVVTIYKHEMNLYTHFNSNPWPYSNCIYITDHLKSLVKSPWFFCRDFLNIKQRIITFKNCFTCLLIIILSYTTASERT